MSLFGGASSAQKPSLFGASQPATTQSGLSLSGSTAVGSGSLFGNSLQPPASSAPSSGSLFGGALGQSQAPKPATSLFGAPQTTPAANTGSLFGSTAPQNTTTAATGSLFGGTAPPAQKSLFPASSATPAGGLQGLFSSKPGANAAAQAQSTNTPQQSQAATSTNQKSGAYFDSLLEKSRKRAHGESALEELPSLQLGLGDLRQRLRGLGDGAQDNVQDGRAQYLLAGSGVDLGAAVRDLTYLDVQTKRERQAPTAPAATDVETYLANLETQTTLSMIADGLAKSARDFDQFLEEHVTMEWDAQRKRIYQHFGLKPRDAPSRTRDGNSIAGSTVEQGSFGRSRRSKAQSNKTSRADGQGGSAFGRSGMQKSVIGASSTIGGRHQASFSDVEKSVEAAGNSVPAQDDRLKREKKGKFAEKVQSLNAARIQQQTYPVLQQFSEVENQTSDEHVEHVVKAYSAMIEMTGETAGQKSLSDSGSVKPRQYADAYLDENVTSTNSISINRRILSGACRHLEKQFLADLEVLIAKNPREANLGGVPNVLSKVRAYIRLRAARKDLVQDDTDLTVVDGDYVWALIFYLLRSGFVAEAVRYVASNNTALSRIDRNFITYISDYANNPDRRLRDDLQDRIKNEYNQRVRVAPEGTIDPFRLACYNIIGRCDVVKRSLDGLLPSLEDWLWLQFILAREASRMNERANEVYGLKEVQEAMDNIVSKHAQGSPSLGFGVFFYIQVLAGRFEQAISFLYAHQYIDAVHFAIALDYYGLLRIAGPSAPDGELLTYSTRNQPQLNFARMVGYYTQDFRAANVIAAVDYLTLICLNGDIPGELGQIQKSLCHEALRELVLETREFAQLLGDVQRSGVRVKGAIEERIRLLGLDNTEEFMRTITVQAAGIADDNGRITDAVLLYHLAGEYNYVVSICNRALSDALNVEIGQAHGMLVPAKSRPGVEEQPENENSPALSLTSCDDPIKLGKLIGNIYYSQSMFRVALTKYNWNTLEVLLKICDTKDEVAAGNYMSALDVSHT